MDKEILFRVQIIQSSLILSGPGRLEGSKAVLITVSSLMQYSPQVARVMALHHDRAAQSAQAAANEVSKLNSLTKGYKKDAVNIGPCRDPSRAC